MQINKKSNINKIGFSINHVYSLLFGMLGSMIILTIYHYSLEQPKKIATVNVTSIVKDFVKSETSQNKPPDTLTNEVKKFSLVLERTIKEVSKDNNVLLMPSEAVFAGSQDYTYLIKLKMNSFTKNIQVEKNG